MKELYVKMLLFLGIKYYCESGDLLIGFLNNKRGKRIITCQKETDKLFEENICWL